MNVHSISDTVNERLFGNLARVVVQPIADFRHCLYASELELLKTAGTKRFLEFSTGRDCAHQALHQLGCEICPVLKGPEREPLWPSGFIGSITHCRDLAGAVVADKTSLRSVGFDIENIKPVNPGIARHICTPLENAWVSRLAAEEQNLALLTIFSVKEAVFKCVYQATGRALRFAHCTLKEQLLTGPVLSIAIDAALAIPDTHAIQALVHLGDSHIYSAARWPHLPAVG